MTDSIDDGRITLTWASPEEETATSPWTDATEWSGPAVTLYMVQMIDECPPDAEADNAWRVWSSTEETP